MNFYNSALFLLLLFGYSTARPQGETCVSNDNCDSGLHCETCVANGNVRPRCTRIQPLSPFSKVNGLPFNRYSWLTTHNSFARLGARSAANGRLVLTTTNQQDTITDQLNDGVRGLMLDMYDFNNDVWLCHSFRGNCYNYTAFTPATNVLTEVRVFLEANPSEIITVIIEDYVRSPNGLTRAFNASGLMRFWFPVSRMPRNGQDWPTVDDMVQNNQRLVVFTSRASKESSERIAYQWRYMVENQYGDGGMRAGSCPNRSESPAMNTTTRSLVLMNYFPSTPSLTQSCRHNSAPLISMMNTCYEVAGRRWPNFIAVDYYRVFCCLRKSYADKLVQDLTRPVFSSMNLYLDTLILQRSDGGGAPQAVDTANGQLVCGCANIASCRENMTFGACEVAGDIAPSGEFNNQTSLGQFDSRPIRFQWLIGVFLMAGMSL